MEGVQTVDVSWLHHSQKGQFASGSVRYTRGLAGRMGAEYRGDFCGEEVEQPLTYATRSSSAHKISIVDNE